MTNDDLRDAETGQFLKGHKGPGRPKGARSKLGEAFIADLYADWMEHGLTAIAKVREERPQDYLKVTASILPKQVEVKTDAFDGISNEELASLIAVVRAAVGPPEDGSRDSAQDQPESTGELSALH